MLRRNRIDMAIDIFAPRGIADFVLKMLAMNTAVLLLMFAFEVGVHGESPEHLPEHLLGVALLSIPLSAASLAAISYLSDLRRRLVLLATTDILTGLNNRRAFMDAAGHAATYSGGVLMLLDLDHFKRVNDTYGHSVGDLCLQAMADVLRAQLREQDIVGRIGGEEFAVFLMDAPIEAARTIGERLSEGASVSLNGDERIVNITASIGAVEIPANDDLQKLLGRADMAMYDAKSKGRARLVFWESLGRVSGLSSLA